MEAVKALLYVAATLVMLGAEVLLPEAAEAASGFYVSILTGYLGLDVWGMIRRTSMLPQGRYKDIKAHRYVICALGYLVLVAAGYGMRAWKGYDYGAMFSVFVSAMLLMVTVLLGGLEGNKLAAMQDGTGGKEDTDEE